LPGIGFISVSNRAWQLVDNLHKPNHGWYLNLRTWRQYATEWGAWHPTPVTLPTNIILALRTSLQKILNMGLEAHFEKYRRASQAVRLGLRKIGFEMFVEDDFASPIVTGVCGRAEFKLAEMSQWLAEQRDIAIGGGLGELSGRMFRVGHLGKASSREYLVEFLFAMEEFLRLRGIQVPLGFSLVGL
jgi:aspartate aminotransferase-like enzyme